MRSQPRAFLKDKSEMEAKEKISEHITYEEATESQTAEDLGIDNTPSDEIIEVMKLTARKVFEPVRRFYQITKGMNGHGKADPLGDHRCRKRPVFPC